MNRHGELLILDEAGRERERYGLTYGAKIWSSDGAEGSGQDPALRVGSVLDADPHRSRRHGEVRRHHRRVTMQEQLDEVTGLSRKVIIESKDADTRPRISLKDEQAGKTKKIPGSNQEARYFLPGGRQHLRATTATASRPATSSPRSRARPPRPRTSPAVCRASPSCSRRASPRSTPSSPRSTAWCRFGKDTKGKRKVVITPEIGEPKEYLISKGKHLSVREGDRVQGRRAADGRRRQPARHPQGAGREGAGQVPGRRGAGGLSPAGRQDQRQAHRGRSCGRCCAASASTKWATPTSSSTSRSSSTSSRRRTSG